MLTRHRLATILASAATLSAAILGVPAGALADETPSLSIYGFLRFDAIYNDSPMSDVAQPFVVISEPAGAASSGDDEFTMHPRMSRFGLTVDEFQLEGDFEGEGTLEIDFQPSGSLGGALRVRHAYFAIKFDDELELLAGQTWDLISPLFPAANNDTLMGNAGNTGDRRTQLRLVATPNDRVRVGVALAMPGLDIDSDGQDLDGDGRLDGVASGLPMLQWVFEARTRGRGASPLRIGLWGHVGKESLGNGDDLSTYSVGVHAFAPINRHLALLGEAFHGRNLNDIRGGIGLAANPITGAEIDATGGWLELVYVADKSHMGALGGTLDAVSDSDIPDGFPRRNGAVYAVYRYRPTQALQLGVEYLYWATGYKNAPDGDANRLNLHLSLYY